MYHPSMWHPIPPLDMAAAFRSIRQTTGSSSPNSSTTSPEKPSLFNPAHGAFSVNTLLNQTSPDHSRMPSAHTASLNAAAAAVHHHHHLFSTLLHHYPYSAAFRPLLNGATGLLTSSTGSNSSLSSSSSSSITNVESSAFVPAGKRFKSNAHDENHCDQISPSERDSEDSFSKYSESRCRSSAVDLQNPHCPICQISLSSQEMLAHIQQELDILERTTRQMSKSSARHSHPANGHQKILQENTINNIDQTFKTRYETYIRVRTSRQQRLNAKLQFHHRRLNRHDSRPCPICYQLIPFHTDEEYFFTHVQQCSRKREQFAASAALSAITHQHRVPMTLPSTNEPIADDPDVNVVDMDDGIERDDHRSQRQSHNESSSTADQSEDRCQESVNSDPRFSPTNQQTDLLYSSSKVTELDPPKCVVCMD